MYKIVYIKEKAKNLLLLGISEEGESARYTVNLPLYEELGMPSVGHIITEGEMEIIRTADEEYRARKKALDLLALADNNRKNLKAKLLRAGFKKEICAMVVDEMAERGYVDERGQIKRLVLREFAKKRGVRRITASLCAKGYSMSDINSSIRELCETEELDFSALRQQIISSMKDEGHTAEEIKKYLYKQGF